MRKTIAELEAQIARQAAHNENEVARLRQEADIHRAASDRLKERAEASDKRVDELKGIAYGFELAWVRSETRLALLAEQERKADGEQMVTLPRRIVDQRFAHGGVLVTDHRFGRDDPKPWWK